MGATILRSVAGASSPYRFLARIFNRLLAVLGLLAAFVASAAAAPATIVVLGDSLAAGFGLRDESLAFPARLEAALKANNKVYAVHMYEGKQHGFHNDTTPRYDEESAKLAWTRTLEFFNKHLR